MYQFFIQPDSIKEEEIWIADPQDVNHIRNVLRMKKEEKVSLCCEAKGKEYICSIEEIESDIVKAAIIDIKARVRELADLTERMHVALGKLENCKINIEAGIDGLSPMESSQVKSNNQT